MYIAAYFRRYLCICRYKQFLKSLATDANEDSSCLNDTFSFPTRGNRGILLHNHVLKI